MAKKDLNEELAVSYRTMRQAIGYFGFGLPLFLLIYSALGQNGILPSVSDYYYSGAGDVFVGVLAIIGFFLILYRGHPNDSEHGIAPNWTDWFSDRWVSLLGGIGALGTAYFPLRQPNFDTAVCPDRGCDIGGIITPSPWLHFGFAGLFLLMTAFFCLFLFTRGNGTQENIITKNGMRHRRIAMTSRNKFFLTCGLTIVVCLIALTSYQIIETFSPGFTAKWVDSWNGFFWIEVIAIVTFAQAWLEKGRSTMSIGHILNRN